MTNDLTKSIDLNQAAKDIKEKIKSAFAELITPEQWQELCRVELEKYTKPGGELSTLIQAELKPMLVQELKTAMHDWTNQGHDPSTKQWSHIFNPLIRQWLNDNKEDVLRVVVQETLSAGVANLMGQLRYQR